jgi:hypothetical protein
VKEYKQLVLSNARSGRDDEFNEWYSDEHIPTLLKIPEYVSAQRYRNIREDDSEADALGWRYMTLYTIKTDDMSGLTSRLSGMLGTESMPLSDSADSDGVFSFLGEPI